MRSLFLALGLAVGLSNSTISNACSAFMIDGGDEPIVGKSYDWSYGFGHMLVNKKNLKKKSLTFFPQDRPIEWVSKHGSVTFNQWGVEFPMGGMNDAGLVVEILLLGETEYPAKDSRQAVNELQWIQYQLDNFATTEEVISNVNSIRVSPLSTGVHYFICDAGGDCGVFEYLDGQMVVSGPDIPWPAITNLTYEESVAGLSRYDGFGGSDPISYDTGFHGRFVTLASRIKDYDGSNPVDYARDTLKLVRDGGFSKWNIVYKTKSQKVFFKMAADGNPEWSLDMGQINFSCKEKRKYLELEAGVSGDAKNELLDYSHSKNAELIRRTATRDPRVPEIVVATAVQYPKSIRCVE